MPDPPLPCALPWPAYPGVVDTPWPADAEDALELLRRFPAGWSRATYDGRSWGVSRTSSVGDRVHRVYAEALAGPGPRGPGGPVVVSANLYRVGRRTELRPCEMPAEVVLDFLARAVPGEQQD
ncbi:MAG: peptide methionine sulfoxide reductase [Marmoricola sp.]|nr:peptide methionine sulfoxide reductase [Marmoricola sp.]